MKSKKSILIKLIAGLLVCAGALSFIAAGGQQSTGGAVSGSAANCNPKGVFPIAKQTVTFTAAVRPETTVSDVNTNAYVKMLEEKGNVKFDFSVYPSGNPGQEKILVEIAAGGTLPELLWNFGFNEEQIYNLGTEGAVISLNKLYDEYGYDIPKQLEKTAAKDVFQKWHSPDGNIYYVMGYGEQIGEQYALRAWMNVKWLEKLNLKSPTTTAEFRTVLEAFRDRDPNGNGRRDEIPAGGNTDVRGKLHEYLMNAFVYCDTRDYLVVNNGKVESAYTKPEWRDGLRYIGGLMKDGLILDQLFTISAVNLRNIIESQDVATVGVFTAGLAGALSPNNQMRLEYEPIPPLKGPQGVQWAVYMPSELQKRYVISRSCRNPEIAFRIGDYMCGEDATIWSRFGIPNVDWRFPQPGEKSMYEDIGMSAMIVPILPWGATQNSHLANGCAYIRPMGLLDGQVTPPNPLDNEIWIAAAAPMYMYLGPPADKRVDFTMFTFQEMEARKDMQVAIINYVRESMALFIMGQRDIERDWDTYLRELDRMGLTRYLEITQSGYERAIGKK